MSRTLTTLLTYPYLLWILNTYGTLTEKHVYFLSHPAIPVAKPATVQMVTDGQLDDWSAGLPRQASEQEKQIQSVHHTTVHAKQ